MKGLAGEKNPAQEMRRIQLRRLEGATSERRRKAREGNVLEVGSVSRKRVNESGECEKIDDERERERDWSDVLKEMRICKRGLASVGAPRLVPPTALGQVEQVGPLALSSLPALLFSRVAFPFCLHNLIPFLVSDP